MNGITTINDPRPAGIDAASWNHNIWTDARDYITGGCVMDADKICAAQDKLYAVDNLSDDGLREALRILEPVRAARIAALREDAEKWPSSSPARANIEAEIRLLENYPLA